MKKIILAVVIGTTLAGCELSADKVQAYTEKCESRGGIPVLVKDNKGYVLRVRCEIDGNMYLQGDY